MTHSLIMPGKNDAENCAKLMYMAGPNVYRYLFGLDEPGTIELLAAYFNVPETPYAKEKIIMFEDENTTMGFIQVFPVRDVNALEWNFIKKLMWNKFRIAVRYIYRGSRLLRDPRLLNDELYISCLAVFPAYRGRGIATTLLKWAEQEAQRKGLNRVSLFVEIDNDRAKRLYEKFGFRETKRKKLPKSFQQFGLTGFAKMVKDVHPQ
jgi:GNAT superfamily N-acetyltransferase